MQTFLHAGDTEQKSSCKQFVHLWEVKPVLSTSVGLLSKNLFYKIILYYKNADTFKKLTLVCWLYLLGEIINDPASHCHIAFSFISKETMFIALGSSLFPFSFTCAWIAHCLSKVIFLYRILMAKIVFYDL